MTTSSSVTRDMTPGGVAVATFRLGTTARVMSDPIPCGLAQQGEFQVLALAPLTKRHGLVVSIVHSVSIAVSSDCQLSVAKPPSTVWSISSSSPARAETTRESRPRPRWGGIKLSGLNFSLCQVQREWAGSAKTSVKRSRHTLVGKFSLRTPVGTRTLKPAPRCPGLALFFRAAVPRGGQFSFIFFTVAEFQPMKHANSLARPTTGSGQCCNGQLARKVMPSSPLP